MKLHACPKCNDNNHDSLFSGTSGYCKIHTKQYNIEWRKRFISGRQRKEMCIDSITKLNIWHREDFIFTSKIINPVITHSDGGYQQYINEIRRSNKFIYKPFNN